MSRADLQTRIPGNACWRCRHRKPSGFAQSRSPRELQSALGLLEELEEYGIELPNGVEVIGVKKLRVATREAVDLARVMGGSESIGLALGKLHGEFKPSSVFLRVFPALKKVVELTRSEAKEFMRGKDHRVEGRGYRVVKSGHLILGCGFARDGVLENKVPKKEWLV